MVSITVRFYFKYKHRSGFFFNLAAANLRNLNQILTAYIDFNAQNFSLMKMSHVLIIRALPVCFLLHQLKWNLPRREICLRQFLKCQLFQGFLQIFNYFSVITSSPSVFKMLKLSWSSFAWHQSLCDCQLWFQTSRTGDCMWLLSLHFGGKKKGNCHPRTAESTKF